MWRFEVRGPDGLWNVLEHPWHSTTEVRNRTAEDVAGELLRGFVDSADYPGDGSHWRVLLWWHEEGDPAGARYRLAVGPDAPLATPRESLHKWSPTIWGVLNPLAHIASRWTPSPRTVQRAALAALVMSVVIVVTGGAVRLTGSGLGCDTWPKCTDDSLIVTQEQGFHGAIEFGNRMLTYVLSAAVGWGIIAARSAKPWRHSLTKLGWVQFAIVMANAVLGGITVLTGLNPYSVAGHFLLATALITVTTVTWQRTREGDGAPGRVCPARCASCRGRCWRPRSS